jgi:D-glycero-alpha-D-manno-heptose-7-phosphate kinase
LDIKKTLLQGQLDDFGRLLHDAWINKQKMATAISNPGIDALYQSARQNGALGGKLLGAGGGGYLLVYCPFGRKHIIAKELEKLGGQVVEFGFHDRGMQTWEVRTTEVAELASVPYANGRGDGSGSKRCVLA